MSREFTSPESQAFAEVEPQLHDLGLVVYEHDGKDGMLHNTERFQAYFDLNPTISVTVQTILVAVQQMKDQLRWRKSAEQIRFDTLLATFSVEEQTAFNSWKPTGRLIKNLFNNVVILEHFQRNNIKVTGQNLDQITNYGIASQLQWTRPEEKKVYHTQDGRPSRATSGEKFDLPSGNRKPGSQEEDRTYVGGRKNHALDPRYAPAASSAGALEAEAKAKAEDVKGRSHSHTAQIQRLFITRPGTSEIDWKGTLEARLRAAGVTPTFQDQFMASIVRS